LPTLHTNIFPYQELDRSTGNLALTAVEKGWLGQPKMGKMSKRVKNDQNA
jgi:hypothetical protein